MIWFKGDNMVHVPIQAEDLHVVEEEDLLTRNLGTLERGLQSLHAAEDRLTEEIDALSEQLRQTKVAIDAYTLAQAKLLEGKNEVHNPGNAGVAAE